MFTVNISVITINLNNKRGLEITIQSVIEQEISGLEFIVIDGASTDGSLNIIEKFRNNIDAYVSEKDTGVYNAMNKGILMAKGKYLIFLNSGDFFVNNTSLASLCEHINKADIIYGDLVVDEGDNKWIKQYPEKLTFLSFIRDSLPHPCSIIKRSLFDKVGLYNEKLKITSDWEFFMNAICKYNATYLHIPFPISVFNIEGISSNEGSDMLIKKEKRYILENYYSAFLPDYELLDEQNHKLNNIKNSRIFNLVNTLRKLFLFNQLTKFS